MRDLLEQIRFCNQNNIYYVSFFMALSLPDICGAMSSENGRADGRKYEMWFDKYVGNKYEGFLNGKDCYVLRCSILHQGRTALHNKRYKKVIFVEPSSTNNTFHINVLNDALNIDVRIFCDDILNGVEEWFEEYEDKDIYKKNYPEFIKRYENGLSPYFVGIPIIC